MELYPGQLSVTWCPFCFWSLSYDRSEGVFGPATVEAWLEDHLARHVEEMMAAAG